jgi:hypothetical protein
LIGFDEVVKHLTVCLLCFGASHDRKWKDAQIAEFGTMTIQIEIIGNKQVPGTCAR